MPSRPAIIPQPRPLPLLGNIRDIDPRAPVGSMVELARAYGPIFRLEFPTQTITVLGSHELVADACDESRFDKHVHGPLRQIRAFAGDGLFTAHTDEPNWAKAHRLLMPAFGPGAMRDYFDDMLEIADQMLTKWARLGPDASIDIPDNMTRLTLDTIALSGFGFRFNSFYQREMHPFVDAMVRALAEAGSRSRRMPVQNRLLFLSQQHYDADARYMHDVTDELIAARKQQGAGSARDLLGLMLDAADPVTGEKLSDENIRYQLVTFLIAGHETTSGLLSFATHLLLSHPHVLAEARARVDAVLGDRTPRFEDIAQLGYLDQVLRETLRLYPTAPAFGVHPRAATMLGGKFAVDPDDVLIALLPALHRDPAVWRDPEAFDPDRFSPERRDAIPVHAWKPFGNGQRSCIGRAFAMQEATLVLAMMLQRFDVTRADATELVIKETLTLKPAHLAIRAQPRRVLPRVVGSSAPATVPTTPVAPAVASHGTPLLVLYGSNSGASEGFARRLAGDAVARGYAAEVGTLDSRTGALPTDGAVMIVTSSYNGEPPDNARRFCAWVDALAPGALAGVRYTVFGCGNRDWASTYQAVPQRIDAALARAGATAIAVRGEGDGRADLFGDFDRWYAPLFPEVDQALGVESARPSGALYAVEVLDDDLAARSGLSIAVVTENRELVDMSASFARSKRHLELALPTTLTYQAGDYLAVLPENHPDLVARAARRFGLRPAAAIVLRSTRGAMAASLPIEKPIAIGELLARYVELGAPATRRDLERLAASNPCPPHKAYLLALASERYAEDVLAKRLTVLDVLEDFPSCGLSFAELLELLPPMRVRQYSISSSPRRDPARCTLTVAVVDAPAWSGHGRFRGACSTYLSRLAVGDRVAVSVRTPTVPFHPPADNSAPMILVGAGTGIAPLRGFLEDRALREDPGETLLFFGCDHPDVDFLYREELPGFVEVHAAFFQQPAGEIRFVQHRLWEERDRVHALLERGAFLFLCGDGLRMGPEVRATLARIHATVAGTTEDAGRAWLAKLEATGHIVSDLFA